MKKGKIQVRGEVIESYSFFIYSHINWIGINIFLW